MNITLDESRLNLLHHEVDDICHPLTQHAAQLRYLKSIGVHAKRRADGSPLVSRHHYQEVMAARNSGAKESVSQGPNWSTN